MIRGSEARAGAVQEDKPASHRKGNTLVRRLERLPGVLALALIGVSLGMVRLVCWDIPSVSNMDEFSVLLQADTFRHVRLTNPTHPLWQSFETLHVIQVPSYASKFPPAPGAVVALAQTIFGNPIWGSWLSVVLATLAVFWMFCAWLPRRWAFLGGLLAAVNPVVLFWGRSYLACGVGLVGAAVAIGAAQRIIRQGGWRNGTALAVGLGVLANTRPFEGLVLALLIAAWMGKRGRWHLVVSAGRGAVPVGIAILGFMGYYNWRVTGDPLILPHTAHHRQYDMAPSFIFSEPPSAPEYRDAHIRDFHRWELHGWEVQHHGIPWAILSIKLQRLARVLGSPAGLFILSLPFAWRNSHVRYAAIGVVVMSGAMLSTIWLNLNYAAPIAVLYLVMEVGCLRYLVGYGPMRHAPLTRAIAALLIALSVLVAVPLARGINLNDSTYGEVRQRMVQSLSASYPEGNVIFVRYGSRHFLFEEWVYNSADIDHQPVIWVLDKGFEGNERVRQYFAGRRFWLLFPDERSLVPYAVQ